MNWIEQQYIEHTGNQPLKDLEKWHRKVLSWWVRKVNKASEKHKASKLP